MQRTSIWSWRFVLLLLGSVCAGLAQTSGQIRGTATYRERMALPPNAVFEATLEDVSKADAPAEVIGRARIEHPRNPPIAFEITYDPSTISSSHRYAVRAVILVEGEMLFTTDQHYPVLTEGRGKRVKLLLRRASAPKEDSASASVENTHWKLTNIGDSPVTAPSPNEPHLILDSKTHRVSGSGGCNRLMGSYELTGDQLTFSHVGSTRMACAEGMDTEKQFLDALGKVKTWKLAEHQLELRDGEGHLVARFEMRAMN